MLNLSLFFVSFFFAGFAVHAATLSSDANVKNYLGVQSQLKDQPEGLTDSSPSQEPRADSVSFEAGGRVIWMCRTRDDRYVVDGSEERRKCRENGGSVMPVPKRDAFVDSVAPSATTAPVAPTSVPRRIDQENLYGTSPYDTSAGVQATDRWQHPERFK